MLRNYSKGAGHVPGRFVIFTIAAVALWIALPFMVQFASMHTSAQGPATTTTLTATLTGAPIGDVTPHGSASYVVGADGTNTVGRHLTVEVSSVNLPGGTHLAVFLNSNNIGAITLDGMHGSLQLSTTGGGVVPPVVAGDVLTVRGGNAATPILSGTFAGSSTPTPTPTGTPTVTPTPVSTGRLYAPLTGPAIDGIIPRGLGQYAAAPNTGTVRTLDVFVSFVNLPEGTVLTVSIAGPAANPVANVGTITLHDHAGNLHMPSSTNGPPPLIVNGTPITVRNGSSIVLSGIFTNTPPDGTPTPTPTPSSTPPPIRAFTANLNGANMVPPVTTEGHGTGFINLNGAGTQIVVHVGFMHLSSAPTAVTINGPAMAGETGPVIFTLGAANTPSPGSVQAFPVNAEQVHQLRNGLWYFQVATTGHPDGEIRGQIRSVNHRDDFDGDGLSDISVLRVVTGFAPDNAAFDWYRLNSLDNTVALQSIGHPGDLNVQGDYDGDGTADIAMFTPSDGNWQILGSSTRQTMNYHWGSVGDVPVVGDYDGDGINDLAVFRPSDGNWYVQRSSNLSVLILHWGAAGDRPVSGDFDGDGKGDMAVFRPSSGDWFVLRSSDSGYTIMHWGLNGDLPVAGDFDGDGVADIAVFRPSEGNWYIYRSTDGGFLAYHFGSSGDIPVACEFDGDGVTDIAVFRPADGNWYIAHSSGGGVTVSHFGLATDRPTTTVYTP